MDIHLLAAGTLTADMFIAAGLDAFPRFEGRVLAAVDALDALHPVACSLEPFAAGELTGQRFTIEPFNKYFGHIPHAFGAEGADARSIQRRLDVAHIPVNTRRHARKILESICSAESRRQRVAPDRVVFEESAGWNTLAQVAAAAALIDALQASRWTASPFPATASEDVAGCAILRHVCPANARNHALSNRPLVRSGAGYGADSGNVLRFLCFDSDSTAASRHDGGQPDWRGGQVGEQTNQ